MNKLGLILAAGLLLTNSAVHSAERDDSSIFVLEAGAHSGGDKLATVYYYGGDTQSVEAGSGVSLALGVRFNVSDSMETVITYGNKTDTVTAASLDLSFSRNPLNALFLLKSGDWHYGAGLTYHTAVEYKRDSTYYGNASVPFKNALGFIADFRYFFSQGGYVGGRYTNINYEVESDGQSFNGNSIGVVVGVYL